MIMQYVFILYFSSTLQDPKDFEMRDKTMFFNLILFLKLMKRQNKYLLLIAISVLNIFLIIGYLELTKIGTAIADEDCARIHTFEQRVLFDNSFSGKVIAEENDSPDNYRLLIKLDSENKIQGSLYASSNNFLKYKLNKYNDYRYDGYNVSLFKRVMRLKVSKCIYFYSKPGDLVEKKAYSDTLKVYKNRFLISKNRGDVAFTYNELLKYFTFKEKLIFNLFVGSLFFLIGTIIFFYILKIHLVVNKARKLVSQVIFSVCLSFVFWLVWPFKDVMFGFILLPAFVSEIFTVTTGSLLLVKKRNVWAIQPKPMYSCLLYTSPSPRDQA
eukprot:TRINITY_DN23359_c0_g1_i1.p1 TRINITY_DN23359_c0_g1~~TRINITY_DN23359_c0_g1_i1.p1  ORF type:complete len:327 (-),score=22.79 TRINITY_DN23359_c0_g1_i1:95-1075(-)